MSRHSGQPEAGPDPVVSVVSESRPGVTGRQDLAMAWAVDVDSGAPRYILELDAAHRGAQSHCKCPSCGEPLVAVNAAKTRYRKRPHFRHPAGAGRATCLIVAARTALATMFGRLETIQLPRLQRSRSVEGLSGQYFDAWVDRPGELVRLSACAFEDETTAVLALDDGRRLVVKLVGRGAVAETIAGEAVQAQIELQVDDPAIARMSPEQIYERLTLGWSEACWQRHWDDTLMYREAEAKARQAAAEALDWCDDGELPPGLSPSQRRETLLHREVKAILAREKRIRLPGLAVVASYQREDGFVDRRDWSEPDEDVDLGTVSVEQHLGCAVPDLLVEWNEDGWTRTVLIEVTVTNPVTEERLDRVSSFGFPVLEIDVGRMGGRVTREELKRLVVDEVAGKRWLFHPRLIEEHAALVSAMRRDAAQVVAARRRRLEMRETAPAEWGRRFLEAFQARWAAFLDADGGRSREALTAAEQRVREAAEALELHGYATAADLDGHPLRVIVARLLSIRDNVGVEYKCADAWGVINAILCERERMQHWQTLYLIAVRVFRPALRPEHEARVAEWRATVLASVGAGERTFVRDTTYDALLGLLFPAMAEALKNDFGTTRSAAGEALPAAEIPSGQYLDGKAYEDWARRYPEAAAAWEVSPAGRRHRGGR